jgi:glycerophosphoryl diester phosphodiesterase
VLLSASCFVLTQEDKRGDMRVDLKDKKFVYHRALNTEKAFREFVSRKSESKYTLSAEGDVCWAYINDAFVIYIHHPDVQGKSLTNEKILELLAKDELLTLDKLFSINSDVNFILELKTGNGNLEDFFIAFRETLERHNVSHAIVDAFSVEQLKGLKKAMPNIKTSLHTKFVMGKYVLETTFEKPYVRMHNLYDLNFIDYITISYTTTHTNLCNLDIDKTYADVYNANKGLNLGAIKSMESFDKAIHSKTQYLYLRSKEVVNSYESVLDNYANH